MTIRLSPKSLNPIVGMLGLVLLLTLLSGTVHAQGPSQAAPYSEQEAQSIDRMLMCPVCVGTNIDQSQALIAQQMQGIVREMLAQGAGRKEILDFFVDRYGLSVLAAPPKSGANLLVWVLPIAGVLAALAGGFFIIRAMAAKGGEPAATGPLIDEALGPYLEAVDRELFLQDSLEERAATRSASVDSPESEKDAAAASDVATSVVEHPRIGPLKQKDGKQKDG